MITLTGLGLMMSSLLIDLSQGNLFLLLLLTMVASLILGMGVPPVAAYIVLAILVVPALIKMGVYPLAAHLFVFYFATIAGITPPMAPDAFVAAGISGAPMMKTALTACRLAVVIFVVPYMFVYNKALLLVGELGADPSGVRHRLHGRVRPGLRGPKLFGGKAALSFASAPFGGQPDPDLSRLDHGPGGPGPSGSWSLP